MSELVAQPPQGKQAALVSVDSSPYANMLDTVRFEHAWRVASMFSKSDLVPKDFKGKPENCFIALQMALRLQVDAMMLMQSMHIIHGKPGLDAKFATAMINTSGLFNDQLEFEIEGTDPHKEDYRVRAFAVRKTTGKTVYGPWVDWKMVKGEGWYSKDGSKWKTMPGVMFQYRAAAFFGRTVCPERLLGMHTVDEIQDGVLTVEAEPLSQGSADELNAAISKPLSVASEPVKEAGTAKDPVVTEKPSKPKKKGDRTVQEFDALDIADKSTYETLYMGSRSLGLSHEDAHDAAITAIMEAKV